MQFQYWLIGRRAIAVIVWIACISLISCMENEETTSDDEVLLPSEGETPSNGDNGVDVPNGDAGEKPVALPGLPDFTAGYDQWLRLNAEPIPPNDGPDPHLGTKNVYVNQEREVIAPGGQQAFPYPDGSIVVKDAVRPGKDFIGLVAFMKKTEGIDPAHNDWLFEEYTRNAADANFSKIADGAVCWNCHSGVADIDYVFTPLQ